jgi:hypothetical protein
MRGRCNSRSISGALIFKEKGLLALRQSQQSDKGWRHVMLYDLSRWHGYLLLEGWQRGVRRIKKPGTTVNGIFP